MSTETGTVPRRHIQMFSDYDRSFVDKCRELKIFTQDNSHKDVQDRLQHIGDARIEIKEAISTPLAQPGLSLARTTEGRTLKWALQWAGVGMVAGAVLLGMVFWFWLLAPQTTPTITRLALTLPETAPLSVRGSLFWSAVPMALSPGGKRLAYVGGGEDGNRLYIREMDQLVTRALPGTENAISPFFSGR